MKTRIVKVYEKWYVEFPFNVVVLCPSFAGAVQVIGEWDRYLLATECA